MTMKDSTALKLEALLKEIAPKATMFGHQDDMAYGMGWNGLYNESDVKRVTGSFPAVFGCDLGRIGNKTNIDDVPFDSIRSYIIRAHEMGGVNTISWHAYLPTDATNPWNITEKVVEHLLPGGKNHKALTNQLDLVASFLLSLVDKDGNPIPYIFRPWHEMDGNWFWWGKGHCTPEEYKELYRFTIDYLRITKGIKNMLVGYSPDCKFNTVDEYYIYYPGDEYVDLLGMDNYWDLGSEERNLDKAIMKLEIVVNEAKKKNKIAALTETGMDLIPEADWFTTLDKVVSANETTKQISYVLVWRNFDKTQFFAPYPGHPSVPAFLEWVNKPDIWLLKDLQEYTKNRK
jgi:mannan endo-1,4-beta-mannosidase